MHSRRMVDYRGRRSISVGDRFTAATISDLATWIRGDTKTLNGADVSQFTDRSGNSRHWTQSLMSAQPAWSETGLAGRPCAQFEDDEFLDGPNLGVLTAAEIFLVGQRVADPPLGGADVGCMWRMGASGATTHHPFTDGTIYDDAFRTSRPASANPVPSLASPFVYGVSSGGGSWVNRVNGAQIYTDVATFGAPTITWLGKSIGPSFYFGKIAELIIYGRVLTTEERAVVHSYLGARYGIAMS